ncbi:molybdenum cofactor guanylyltransferase MobA [Thalassobaculum sp.]|uniref:molybdenum cofactor guanylyltransferase MobA n=1 Tax=Thalassobaculum sp. TaxID=2022740 RepID=UPI003B5BBDBB
MADTTKTRIEARPPRSHDDVLGVILAGGLARRMGGGDKGFADLGGRTLLQRVIDRLEGQVGGLVLNANGDPARFAEYRLPVVADTVADHPGPLAGILAGLAYAEAHGWQWIATAPVDTPYLPRDLVDRLLTALAGEAAEIACVASGGRVHPVVGLWPIGLIGPLRAALEEQGIRKVDAFAGARRRAIATWPVEPYDPFLNVNSPADLFEVAHGMRVD